MKKKKTKKLTILDVVDKIIDSDLPLSTRNQIVRHYLLPQLGYTKAVVETDKSPVGTVERPNKEEIEIENNPKLKEEYKDTEKLMSKSIVDYEPEDEY